MSKKQKYSWWTDPKNKEEVERISWWDKEENKSFANIPISIINSESGVWVACTNDDTKKVLGEYLGGTSQGDTKEEAIKDLLLLLRYAHEYADDRMRSYQRWVPFRKGNWKHSGGKWFVIFGIHFYFRYGGKNKGGFFVPFTKLNINISNEWLQYKRFKTLTSTNS